MPRRRRNWMNDACYHITHQCHERKFLFKFAKHRNMYLNLLFEMQKKYNIDILDYIVSSNHVHLLLSAKRAKNIPMGLQFLHGGMAQKYNLLKDREGSFWRNRFHATRIESGRHLGRCLFYIDMNMVRAGAVEHPAEWKHTAYHEFIETKQRYRIVNIERLLECLDFDNEESFRKWYKETLNEKLACENHRREVYWSKVAAIGGEEWLPQAAVDSGLKHCKIKKFQTSIGEDVYYV
ncbi:MAG: transposase [Victivallales bacterium]|nr:transposase [Victivallales bacterium]